MRYRTIAGVVSLLLCSLACGFLNGEAEPEVSAPPPAPAETAAEAEAEPIASASARTVILKALGKPMALICYGDGKWASPPTGGQEGIEGIDDYIDSSVLNLCPAKACPRRQRYRRR